MDDKKEQGEPLGNPKFKGQGDAQPEGAGAEGGLGFIGDQRGAVEEDDLPEMDVDTEPGEPMQPTTGTTTKANTDR